MSHSKAEAIQMLNALRSQVIEQEVKISDLTTKLELKTEFAERLRSLACDIVIGHDNNGEPWLYASVPETEWLEKLDRCLGWECGVYANADDGIEIGEFEL